MFGCSDKDRLKCLHVGRFCTKISLFAIFAWTQEDGKAEEDMYLLEQLESNGYIVYGKENQEFVEMNITKDWANRCVRFGEL